MGGQGWRRKRRVDKLFSRRRYSEDKADAETRRSEVDSRGEMSSSLIENEREYVGRCLAQIEGLKGQ